MTKYEIPRTEHARIGWEPRRAEPKKDDDPRPTPTTTTGAAR